MPSLSPPPSPPTLLSLQDLHLAYPGAPAPVFEGLTADLSAGVGLVCGDEGSGKSSLLALLAGHIQPTAGSMRLAGEPLQAQQVACMDPLHAQRQQQVAQAVLDECVPAALRQHLPELIRGLDLAPHLAKPLYQLSTGSRRKVFLAAALARQARLTVLDQPFIALDRPSVDFLCAHFRDWAGSRERLLLIADYLPPEGVPLSFTLNLDALR